MGEDALSVKALGRTFQQRSGVQQALSGESCGVKGVHIQLAAQSAVGVAAAASGKDEGKIRLLGAACRDAEPRLDHAMATHDGFPPGVDHRTVQGMQGRADQLLYRAGVDLGIRVECQNIARALQRRFLAADLQLALLPAEQPGQRAQRAAFALAAAPVFPVIAARPCKEEKASAVFFIQAGDFLPRRQEHLSVCALRLFLRRGQVRQQAEAERRAAFFSAAGTVQPFEFFRTPLRRIHVAQQRRDHADALPLGGDAAAHVHARQAAGTDQAREDKVRQSLHRFKNRQEKQQRRGKAHAVADQQLRRQGKGKLCRRIDLRPRSAIVREEVKAHMPPFAFGPLDQRSGRALLLSSLLFRQPLQRLEVGALRLGVHAGIFTGRVQRKDQPRHVHACRQFVEVHQRQTPKRRKQCREQLGMPPCLNGRLLTAVPHGTADLRDGGDDRAAQHGPQHFQLALAQDADALKAVKESKQPLLRHLAPARAQQCAAEGKGQALAAARAQRPGGSQRGQRALPLAQDQIVVVQHPLIRRRVIFPVAG